MSLETCYLKQQFYYTGFTYRKLEVHSRVQEQQERGNMLSDGVAYNYRLQRYNLPGMFYKSACEKKINVCRFC